jgi:hypothetical protein
MRAICLFCAGDIDAGHRCVPSMIFLRRFKVWLTTADGRTFVTQMTPDTRTTHPNEQTASIQPQKESS